MTALQIPGRDAQAESRSSTHVLFQLALTRFCEARLASPLYIFFKQMNDKPLTQGQRDFHPV